MNFTNIGRKRGKNVRWADFPVNAHGQLGKSLQVKHDLQESPTNWPLLASRTGKKAGKRLELRNRARIALINRRSKCAQGKFKHSSERKNCEFDKSFGGAMVKLLVRDKESIQEAVRRFRKLVERSGIKKEMRRREYYEKPSETKRRARLRAERRSKRTRMLNKR